MDARKESSMIVGPGQFKYHVIAECVSTPNRDPTLYTDEDIEVTDEDIEVPRKIGA
jgi:hypothetical protein